MRHLFLINPTAGKADCTPRIEAQAKALAEALGEEYEIFISSARGDCTRKAKEAGESGIPTRLYACGGDGTFNECVNGAAPYENLSLTCIPCGSGNDFIKQFRNPQAFSDLGNFLETETQTIDLMELDGSYAANICSVGLDARIGTSIDAFRRMPLLSGSRAYTASIVVNLLKGISKPCRVEIGDTVIDNDLTLVCVCNGSWYGGGYHPVPQASMTDGVLDVLVVKKVSIITVAKVISAYQKGQFARFPHLISHFRTDSIRILTPEKEPANVDGEMLMTKDLTIRVLREQLRLFIPKAAL